jgi:hypothetical protein
MVPCLVPTSTARANNRVWVEAAAHATLARAIALRLGHDETTFSPGQLRLVGRSGLSSQGDERLGVVMVHQESTGNEGRGVVVPGQVLGGSWKAGVVRGKGIRSQKAEGVNARNRESRPRSWGKSISWGIRRWQYIEQASSQDRGWRTR